jgi:hypothetical protein
MRLRRRWVLAGLVGLILLGPALIPWAWYAVPGLLRGEHFFRGLPSSHWRKQGLRETASYRTAGPPPAPRLPPPPGLAGTLQRAGEFFGFGNGSDGSDNPEASVFRNPGAVPVLTDLIHDPDEWIRRCALTHLDYMGPAAVGAVPALIAALQSDPEDVRDAAVAILARIGDMAALTHVFRALLGDSAKVREEALVQLWVIATDRHSRIWTQKSDGE